MKHSQIKYHDSNTRHVFYVKSRLSYKIIPGSYQTIIFAVLYAGTGMFAHPICLLCIYINLLSETYE